MHGWEEPLGMLPKAAWPLALIPWPYPSSTSKAPAEWEEWAYSLLLIPPSFLPACHFKLALMYTLPSPRQTTAPTPGRHQASTILSSTVSQIYRHTTNYHSAGINYVALIKWVYRGEGERERVYYTTAAAYLSTIQSYMEILTYCIELTPRGSLKRPSVSNQLIV